MCGIAGAVALGGGARAGEAVAAAQAAALAHRGPDGRGLWAGRVALGAEPEAVEVCLAHTRLAVIDTSDDAREPLANEDGSILAVVNGELYGHRALRRELERRGHRFKSRCDAEVVVHLYEEEGPLLARRLFGMYAFAILDRARGRLVLARDPQGEKPLYRAFSPQGLVFASEPRGVLAAGAAGGPRVARRVDDAALDAYLALGYVPAGRTLLDGLDKLLPGETLVLERGRLVRSFAPRFGRPASEGGESPEEVERALGETGETGRLDEPAAGAPRVAAGASAFVSARSPASAVRRVRAAVTRAVTSSLESDVPLGAFLSGGLDSTIVTALARRALGRLSTFSVGFDERGWDESGYAALAARALRTEHCPLRLGPDALAVLPDLIWHHGEPFADESAVAAWHLARSARERVTVALTGDGGDELFLGYRRARAARVLGALDAVLPGPLRRLAARLAPPGALGAGGRGLAAGVARLLAGLGGTEAERYLGWTGIFAERGGAALASRIASEGGVTGFDLAVYLPDDLLAKTDRSSMAHGLEARAPLLDRRLAALAAALPARRHAPVPWRGKALLRRAFGDLVPAAIARRGKMGFGVPVGLWLRREPFRALARDLLVCARFEDRAILAPGEAARLWAEHERGERDHGRRLYALLALELWFRQIVDPPAPTPLRW